MNVENSLDFCLKKGLNEILNLDYDVGQHAISGFFEDAKPFVCVPNGGQGDTILKSMVAKANGLDKDLKHQTIGSDTFFEVVDNASTPVLKDIPEGLSGTQLYYWLQQNASTIKANTPHAPDTLSVFEYLKSRAAFAHCLAKKENSEHPFLLVCGDLSGIQEFIYDIHSSKAAMSLKGRSFYLGLVLDAIMRKILQETQMPICNVIYSNGGKFYMLLPNTKKVTDALDIIKAKIAAEIFKEFHGKLYCCLAWVGFGIDTANNYKPQSNELLASGDAINSIADLWRLVTEKAAGQKQQKFKSLLIDKFDMFFAGKLHIDHQSQNTTVCAVTGLPTRIAKANEIAKDIYVLPSVMRQVNLGKTLKKGVFLGVSTTFIKTEKSLNPLSLGIYYTIAETANSVKNTNWYAINPLKNDTWYNENCTGIHYYGGNEQAAKDFETLIKTDDENHSMRKLGVLRMDIDNLGEIFGTNALPKPYLTFAAYSGLSFQLDQFFSGYLNTLRNNDDFKNHVELIYAGGDDIFAVGRWDKTIAFAALVQKTFTGLTGNDDGKITISAGLTIVNPKFPIQKAADLAKIALDDGAKKFGRREGRIDKNAFNLINTNVGWDKNEWEFVWQLSLAIQKWRDDRIISTGFLYKLLTYKEQCKQKNFSWQWRAAYSLQRTQDVLKKQEEKDVIHLFKTALMSNCFNAHEKIPQFKTANTYRILELLCLAAQLAAYHQR
jgi:CRISPR-associated protein Csm1